MARRKGKNRQHPDAPQLEKEGVTPATVVECAPPPIDPARRAELRRKLRSKIKSRQEGDTQQQAARQMIDDPASALLRMGIDDANVLRAAPSLVKSITARARAGKPLTGQAGMGDAIQEMCSAIAGDVTAGGPPEVGPDSEDEGFELVGAVESDDEEAPPGI